MTQANHHLQTNLFVSQVSEYDVLKLMQGCLAVV